MGADKEAAMIEGLLLVALYMYKVGAVMILDTYVERAFLCKCKAGTIQHTHLGTGRGLWHCPPQTGPLMNSYLAAAVAVADAATDATAATAAAS
jgi:hypothetical protein